MYHKLPRGWTTESVRLKYSLSFGPCRAPSFGAPGGLLVFAAEGRRLREELFHQPLRHRLHLPSRIVSYQNPGVVKSLFLL